MHGKIKIGSDKITATIIIVKPTKLLTISVMGKITLLPNQANTDDMSLITNA